MQLILNWNRSDLGKTVGAADLVYIGVWTFPIYSNIHSLINGASITGYLEWLVYVPKVLGCLVYSECYFLGDHDAK